MNSRRVTVVVALSIAVVVIAFAALKVAKSRALAAGEIARASLSRCLLGAPLEAGENASGRVHRIVLMNPPADWPKRCDPLAKKLGDALASTSKDPEEKASAEKWARLGFAVQTIDEAPWELDALFRVESSAQPETGVAQAPPAATAFDERTPSIVAKGSLAGVGGDPIPEKGVSVILSSNTYCRLSPALDKAKCSELTKLAPTGFQSYRLWPPSDDGASGLVTDFVRNFGQVQRFFRTDTGALTDTGSANRSLWAYSYKDGSVVTLGAHLNLDGVPEGYELLRWRGKEHGEPFKIELESERVSLLGDRLLWVSRRDDFDHLMSSPLTQEPLSLGKPVDHGQLDTLPSDFEGCRTSSALAVVLTRGSGAGVLFFSKGGVSEIRTAKLPSDAKVASRVLACATDALNLTRVVTRTRPRSEVDTLGFLVQHARCTADGCQTREIDLDATFKDTPDELRPRGVRPDEVVAGGLGDKLLVVWRSSGRGIRARLAAPDALSSARDMIVYDDRIKGGSSFRESLVETLALFPRHDGAVLFLGLALDDGVKAIRIALDGSLSAVSPEN